MSEDLINNIAGLKKDSILHLCHRLVQALHDGTYETPHDFDEELQDANLSEWVEVLAIAVDQLKLLDWKECGLEDDS
jgi:hypothetical protein